MQKIGMTRIEEFDHPKLAKDSPLLTPFFTVSIYMLILSSSLCQLIVYSRIAAASAWADIMPSTAAETIPPA